MSAQRIDPTPAPSTAARGQAVPGDRPAPAGPPAAPVSPTPPPARGPLLVSCAALLAVAAVIAFLAFSLYSQLGERLGPGPSTADRIEPDPAGGRLTRSERERLGAELAEVERALAQAEGQARIATDPGVRDGWLERAAGLAGRRDALRARLGR
jgi:hypothetical protein